MNIKRLIRLPLFYIILIAIFSLLGTTVSTFPEIEIIYRIIVFIIISIVLIIIAYIDIRKTNIRINIVDLLNLMNDSIFGDNKDHYRSNIMIYNSKNNVVKMKYGCNRMKGDLDSKITIDLNEYDGLGLSQAVRDEAPYWTNTTHARGHSDLVNKRKIPPSMRSVLTVPIFDKSKTLIAILNVDSTLPLSQSYLNNENYYKLITIYADIIGENWVYW